MHTSPLIKQVIEGKSRSSENFRHFALKMEAHKLPPIVINVFKYYYHLLLEGNLGELPDSSITPVAPEDVKSYEDLAKYADAGRKCLDKAVLIKLNGGLGTSMGLEKAKSLLPVKGEVTFLDVIVNQVRRLREKTDMPVPLVFMNSFRTHTDTMFALGDFDNGATGVPMAFLQHMYPKILQDSFLPANWPNNPELEWNPPGHGDIYTALVTSGTLKALLASGFEYAFISNSDNLGAVMDYSILGYMAAYDFPFLMEVAKRTPADKKGGHLCRLQESGRPALREVAQCPEADMDSFQDIEKYTYFNTNSLWVNLKVMEKVFAYHGMMPLDLISNKKTLDPRDPASPPVIQVETAMGSAISAFHTATAVHVPRTRFAPVKTSNDLANVMSDNYVLTDDYEVVQNPERDLPPICIELDSRFYKKIDDFQARFPDGPPSLKACESFQVQGDVLFKGPVTCVGNVNVLNKTAIQATVHADQIEENADVVVE